MKVNVKKISAVVVITIVAILTCILIFWASARIFGEIKSSIHVEVLTIIDHETLTLHGNEANAEIYFLKFWRNVDKYTKLLNKPTVRIGFSGLLVLKSSFLNETRTIDGEINSKIALENLESYVSPPPKNLSHDIVFVFTTRNLSVHEIDSKDTIWKHSNTTMAMRGRTCFNETNLVLADSKALIKDEKKLWTGIKNALFVIGRFLGAEEDGSDGAKSCKRGDGIMDSTTLPEDQIRNWTSCSRYSIRGFLNASIPSKLANVNATCVANKPKEADDKKKLLDSPLPGFDLELVDYCPLFNSLETKEIYPCYSGQFASSNCREFYCGAEACIKNCKCSGRNWGPLPEGSHCDTSGGRCSYGRCVNAAVYEEEIPKIDESS